MSEYKGIKGFQVQTRTEDPVPYAQALADNPYQGVWGSGGSLNTARAQHAGAGTQTSALMFGGDTNPPLTSRERAETESYNGTAYTEVADLNQARRVLAGAGASSTSAIAVGGYTGPGVYTGQTETWNGSSWTEVNDLNDGRSNLGAVGIVTAALAIGGSPPGHTANTETWNGSSWTEVNNLNTATKDAATAGLYTSALCFGGNLPPNTAKCESWDGTSWTEVNDLNTVRNEASGSGASNTAALGFGGEPPTLSKTESWDGTSWTEVNDMATARHSAASSQNGPSSLTLVSGGFASTKMATTEEWAFTGLDPSSTPAEGYANAITGDFYYNSTTGQFKNVSLGVGSWASGGNLNRSVSDLGAASAAPQTAALAFGGESPPGRDTETEKYDGTSWTETGDLNSARNSLRGAGTQTAAIGAGGTPSPSNPVALTETFDGTSWTEVSDLNTGRYMGWMTGTTTAALAFGGYNASPNPPSTPRSTEEWDGSSWTAGGNLNTGGLSQMGFGIQTATTTSKSDTTVEQYNGSSWTEITEYNTNRSYGAAGGLYTDGMIFTGETPPGSKSTATELWDGSSWTETGDMSTGRTYSGGSSGSSSTAGIDFGGSPVTNATEEFTRTLFTIKTVTTS
jgi:hypothetical protein